MTTTSRDPDGDATFEPAHEPVVTDDFAARLQARLEALERTPDAFSARSRPGGRAAPPEATSGTHIPAAHGPADTVEDLNEQLEVLRGQLEDAFQEVEQRIGAAERRAAAAEARLEEVAAAVDDFANDLPGLFDGRRPEQLAHLRAVLSRLQARLHPG